MSSTSSSGPQGILCVYGECGPHVTEEEFNEWYDKEHAPARLTVEGFSSALRYKTTDSQKPSWFAMYDLSTHEIMDSDGYKALGENASQREIDIVNRLQTLHRRVYKLYSTREHDGVKLPSKYLLVVNLQPSQEGEDEFNKWYEEEHMVLLSKVPGWLRGRRYQLLSQTELAGKPDKSNPVTATSYVAIHEFDRPDYFELQEYKTAVGTPWTERMRKEIVSTVELRSFELHKDIGSSQ